MHNHDHDQLLPPRPGVDDARAEELELYALDLLAPDEAAVVEASLRNDPAARALVQELRASLTALTLDLEPVTPTAESRARLLEAVAAESSLDGVGPRALPTARVTPAPASASASATEPVSLTAERERRGLPAWSAWAVAAMLAVALLGSMIWNMQLRQDLDERIATETYQVAGSGPAQQVEGTLTELVGRDEMVLVLHDLPTIQPDRVYQVWLIADGPPVPSIVFTTDTSGVTRILVPQAPEGYQVLAITEEPAGGSQSPTTEPFIQSTLTD